MSLVKSVAGNTIRLQQQNAKAQQKCTKAGAASQSSSNNNNNNNSTTNHIMATTTSQASTGSCLQPSSTPSSSSKTSLSTSPITATFMSSSTCSSSLFSFESGVVLSGSSGCCSLSNSPSSSSSSSSNSYLASQTVDATTSGNQMCANTSTTASHLDESFSSNTCPLNASLLAAVNGDLDDDHVMPKTLPLADSPNQKEAILHVSESMENNRNESVSNGDNGQILLLENLHQQSTTDNSCLNNEDARTLQLAVELTMMNLNQLPSPASGAQTISTPVTSTTNHFQLHSYHLHNGSSIDHHQQLHQPFSSSSYNSSVNNPYHMTTKVFLQTQSQAAATSLLNQNFLSDSRQDNIPSKVSALTSNSNQNLITPATTDERSKKSQNMTECVPVPSSEHVAEIVGRQGNVNSVCIDFYVLIEANADRI